MHFALTSGVFAALVTSVFAQTGGFDPILTPKEHAKIKAGSNFKITWQSTDKYPGKITINLIGGETPETLSKVAVLATGIDNKLDKYQWAVGASLGKDATYGLNITYDSDPNVFQYSAPFHIVKNGDSTTTGSHKPTSTSKPTHSGHPNNGTTLVPPTSRPYPTGSAPTSGYPTGSAPTPVTTAGAATFGASAIALFGGLAVAVLGL